MKFDKTKDTLTFTGMDGQDENYVHISGAISKIKLSAGASTLSSFTLDSADIGKPITVVCMQGTTASTQLKALKGAGATKVEMVGLRNIDLQEALKGNYAINLLGINIKDASGMLATLSLDQPKAWLT